MQPLLALALLVAAAACDREEQKVTPPPLPRDEVYSPPMGTAGPPQPRPEIREYPTGTIPVDPHLAEGYKVYRTACMVCHERGVNNAPLITDVPEWQSRIGKGRETLYRNAINGFTGKRGFMPPKGGSPGSWSDAQVRAAVDYMIHTIDRQAQK